MIIRPLPLAVLSALLLLGAASARADDDPRSRRGGMGSARPASQRSAQPVPQRAPARAAPARSMSSRVHPVAPRRAQPVAPQRVANGGMTRSRPVPFRGGRAAPVPQVGRERFVAPPAPQRASPRSAWHRSPGPLGPTQAAPRSAWSRSTQDAAALRARNAAALQRLRGRVSTRGIRPSPAGDTRRVPSVSGLNRPAVGPSAMNRGAVRVRPSGSVGVRSGTAFGSGATTRTRPGTSTAAVPRGGSVRVSGLRSGSTRVSGTRFGSRVGSRVGSRTVIAGPGGTAVTGGSVRVRPGTRSGRIGRSYRISHHDAYHHHYGHDFGFYYVGNPYSSWYWPWYRAYGPSYGLRFGFGVTWYGPVYEPYFVDATPWYGPGTVISEEIVGYPPPVEGGPYPLEAYPLEEGGVIAPPQEGLVEGPPAAAEAAPPGGFPPPAPQPGEEGSDAPQGHADFEPGVQAFLEADYGRALQHLERVTRDEPTNGEAWLATMHADFALGRYGEAATALAHAAQLEAFPRGYRFDVRPLYRAEGSFDAALEALDRHVARYPQDADALVVRAYFHVAAGERDAGRALVDRILAVRPADETAPRLVIALLPPPPPPAPEAAPDAAGGTGR